MDRHPTNFERSPSHESDDSHLPSCARGACHRVRDDEAVPSPSERERPVTAGENHGLAWVIGSFLWCPCHLPLTLGLAATLLTGTTLGAVLRHHPVAAGVVVTVAWIAGTARGFWLLRVRG